VTGAASQDAREAALAAGASEFLAKPFAAATLSDRVRDLAG
jgi:DNA-binding response OmpR family regulator